ncbi:MAG: tRNA (adenosine(37)-N6)-threonylcarbamoyltransferase complex transferase subunit TsaD [Ferrovibrio sp.]|uniref:tRNA (adenosine(37)-N6)-threonylcarbamoyltransferase complex transferase subunit TsaD n=1 Tax=Ferrovibrio sp. TaxID=1917215 RepID=UPI002630F827|nr:tRNA (adenosine(37)-N6)-threonylcarbamoyltransferase complex transferase subunit TsaD [Ferrovibrio sp.]MCW0236676.1 tRNA (adenosine(37)-N6)-threonylcarbamoyltransferase complex transferase subunit TsaD [Ferrovibrio sp.]
MLVLGIETSCDETACAVVTDAVDPARRIVSHSLFSQMREHAPYGGVVPEIASRAHIEHLDGLVAESLTAAGLGLRDLDAIAATAGPGLIGGVMVGLMTAKTLAYATGKPLIAVNHLEGHALSVRLSEDVPFPYLLLLVSGGHCQFLIVDGVGRYRRLGTTIDDAAGEAFDKTAKLLGLGYPGGPAIERLAKQGNALRFSLPLPLKGRPGCDFSFSGLKTAVRLALESCGPAPTGQDKADLAASFQRTVMAVILDRARHAIAMFGDSHGVRGKYFVVAGGVAANAVLREGLVALAEEHGMRFTAPPMALCTDNGAMIAWAGLERFRLGMIDDLEAPARARWPLDAMAAARPFAGVKA